MTLFHEQTKRIPKEALPIIHNFFRKHAKALPPYNFIVEYAQIMMSPTMMSNVGNSTEASFGRSFATLLFSETYKDVNDKIRIVELHKDLIRVVEDTDNNIFFRPLFFPVVFINNEFKFEHLIFKGVTVMECITDITNDKHLRFALHAPHEMNNDYAIFAVAVDFEQCCEYYLNITLVNKAPGFQFTDTTDEDKLLNRAGEFLRNIVCNVVDMVDRMNEDLELTTIITTKEQNVKRKSKGKFPVPTKIYIKPRGEFKEYVSEFNKDSTKLGYRLLVRGHWRHFRDSRYVNVKDTKIWIKPHYKGKGILIRKDYKIL